MEHVLMYYTRDEPVKFCGVVLSTAAENMTRQERCFESFVLAAASCALRD